MVKFHKKPSLNFVVPQAIFWRPLVYFAVAIRQERDDLDEYEAATYSIGNRVTFDLRHYAGHPHFTVSLYLPFEVQDETQIIELVDLIVSGLKLPTSAVAWKRGQPFEYGQLERPPSDRLHEAEARVLALKIAARHKGHIASTSEVKREAERYFEPSAMDSRRSLTRNEPLWKQIVGNVVSHKGSGPGIFRQGYAERTGEGLKVTPAGLDYLSSIGFDAA